MQIKRIAAITAGLMVAGAVFGTMAGIAVLMAWSLLDGDVIKFKPADLGLMLQISMFFGGGLGAVLGPFSAWVLMRHVPLGIAVGGTTLGTLASGGLGLLVTGDPVFAMLYGIMGFGISALALRRRYPSRAALPNTGSGALIS